MADSPIGPGAQPTKEQAAQIAARFLAHTPHTPRPLTTREADQVQQLIETSRTETDPVVLMYGHWLERMFEVAMALSHELFKREGQLNAYAAQAGKLPAAVQERLEQGLVLALFTRSALGMPDAVLDEVIDRAGLSSRREDLDGAVHDIVGAG